MSGKKKPAEIVLVNKSQLAQAFNVSLPTVDRWLQDNCPTEQDGSNGKEYQFDLEKVRSWREGVAQEEQDKLDKQNKAVEQFKMQLGGGEANPDEPQISTKAKLELIQLEKAQDELAVTRGRLVRASDVRRELLSIFSELTSSLDALPDRFGMETNATPANISVLEKLIRDMRQDLAEKFKQEDLDTGHGGNRD